MLIKPRTQRNRMPAALLACVLLGAAACGPQGDPSDLSAGKAYLARLESREVADVLAEQSRMAAEHESADASTGAPYVPTEPVPSSVPEPPSSVPPETTVTVPETEPAPSGPSEEERTLSAWAQEAAENRVRMLSASELAWFRNRLSDTVFIGDSVAQALVTEGVLPENRVFFKRGAILRDLEETVLQAVASYPKNVVFFKGLNDVDYETPATYAETYAALCSRIKEALPGVRIFICALLPPSNALGAVREDLARSWMFDNEIHAWCVNSGVTYIDLHWLVQQHFYLPDGIHFNKAFYQLFLRYVTVCVKGWEGVPR